MGEMSQEGARFTNRLSRYAHIASCYAHSTSLYARLVLHYCAMRCLNAQRELHLYAVARCPSVRSSVTRRYCVETAKHSQTYSPTGRHTILVFLYQTLWQYSDGASPNGGVSVPNVMAIFRWGLP